MEYLTDDQVVELTRRLLRLTEEGSLSWESSQGSAYKFVATAGKFGFLLRSRDEDDFNPFLLEVHLKEGDGPFRKLQEVTTESTNGYFADLEALYSKVKRRVLNIDKLASELFSELDHLGLEGR